MRVKCLAQEHNAVPRPGLEPGPPDPETSAQTIRSPRLPQLRVYGDRKNKNNHGLIRYTELLVLLSFRLIIASK